MPALLPQRTPARSGCANLAGCANLIKEMSGYNVRIGYPRAKRFTHGGCPGIGDTGAVSTIGMLLYARNDKHLNCIEEVARKEEAAAETAAPEEGTVFDQNIWEVKEPEKKKKKESSATKENVFIKWTKKAVKPVEDFVGSLYDRMDDN